MGNKNNKSAAVAWMAVGYLVSNYIAKPTKKLLILGFMLGSFLLGASGEIATQIEEIAFLGTEVFTFVGGIIVGMVVAIFACAFEERGSE